MSSPPLGSDAVPLPKNRRKKSAIGVGTRGRHHRRRSGDEDAALTASAGVFGETVALATGDAAGEENGREPPV